MPLSRQTAVCSQLSLLTHGFIKSHENISEPSDPSPSLGDSEISGSHHGLLEKAVTDFGIWNPCLILYSLLHVPTLFLGHLPPR